MRIWTVPVTTLGILKSKNEMKSKDKLFHANATKGIAARV
jgi:hypothetical protein